MVTVILMFDPKVKSKDKMSIFEIHFLFKSKYGSDSISSQELHDDDDILIFSDDDVGILCRSLGHVVTGINVSWIRK